MYWRSSKIGYNRSLQIKVKRCTTKMKRNYAGVWIVQKLSECKGFWLKRKGERGFCKLRGFLRIWGDFNAISLNHRRGRIEAKLWKWCRNVCRKLLQSSFLSDLSLNIVLDIFASISYSRQRRILWRPNVGEASNLEYPWVRLGMISCVPDIVWETIFHTRPR